MRYLSITVKMILIIMPIIASSVGWNSIVTTSSTVEYIDSDCFYTKFVEMDQYANSEGLHLVVADDDGISYKKFNTAGVLQSSTSIAASGKYPNIEGDEDNLFIVYLSGYYLYIKKSTNGGGTWSPNDDLYLGQNWCSGIDVELEGSNVHVVYGVGGETYYRRNTNGSWYDYKHVSDGTSGGAPHIALSDNRIHVSWNTDPTAFYCDGDDRYTRDKAGTVWEDEQAVGWYNSGDEDIVVAGDKLHMLYFLPGGMSYPLYHMSRDVDGEDYDWSDEEEIEDVDLVIGATLEITGVTQNFVGIPEVLN